MPGRVGRAAPATCSSSPGRSAARRPGSRARARARGMTSSSSAHRRPPFRLADGRRLAATAHALMDLSDGIAFRRGADRRALRLSGSSSTWTRLPLAAGLAEVPTSPFWTLRRGLRAARGARARRSASRASSRGRPVSRRARASSSAATASPSTSPAGTLRGLGGFACRLRGGRAPRAPPRRRARAREDPGRALVDGERDRAVDDQARRPPAPAAGPGRSPPRASRGLASRSRARVIRTSESDERVLDRSIQGRRMNVVGPSGTITRHGLDDCSPASRSVTKSSSASSLTPDGSTFAARSASCGR